jgi:hypothetical protein
LQELDAKKSKSNKARQLNENENPITSGQPDLKAVEDRVGRIPGYALLFKAAFADAANPITAQNIAKAQPTFFC